MGWKAFMICPQVGGAPSIDFEATPVHGWVQIGTVGGYGAYLMSGSGTQLLAINALPTVIGLVGMNDAGDVRWAELDGAFPTALRTRMNTWLTARGFPTIPTGKTYRWVALQIFKRLNPLWDFHTHDIMEAA